MSDMLDARAEADRHCQTCGAKVWQFWQGPEPHPPGCPDGAASPSMCRQARERAGMLQWLSENGGKLTEQGVGFLVMMERLGAVDRSDRPAIQTGGVQ